MTGLFRAFSMFVSNKGLVYHEDDLMLMLSSLIAGQFVVLGGPGGIGKSSLVLALADFLNSI